MFISLLGLSKCPHNAATLILLYLQGHSVPLWLEIPGTHTHTHVFRMDVEFDLPSQIDNQESVMCVLCV